MKADPLTVCTQRSEASSQIGDAIFQIIKWLVGSGFIPVDLKS